MENKVSTVIRRLMYGGGPLNILTFPTHEAFQTMLSKTGHNFYMISGPEIKQWDYRFRPLPTNHFVYENSTTRYRPTEPIDIVLCQSRATQYRQAQQMAHFLNAPLIVLEHTEPPPGLNPSQLEELKKMRGHVHIYITQHSQQSWGDNNDNSFVIYHGLNPDLYKGWRGEIAKGLSIVNYFRERDVFCGWSIWDKIRQEIELDLVGENPGLSQPISDEHQLIEQLCSHRFYLNTSQWSPVPLSVIEAMMCGMPVVTTAKQELPRIIKNGYNGFISNDVNELIEACRTLNSNYALAKEMGANARATAMANFSEEMFVNNWNSVFDQIIRGLK